MTRIRWLTIAALLLVGLLMPLATGAAAPAFASDAFQRTWARTDQPVASGAVSRTWMWGPQPDSAPLTESYSEAPGGKRTVQYFDKTRMEDNSYRASSPWDVTNGLLAEELITGRMQLGDTTFVQYAPAQVNVAGDPNDPQGPTYASFSGLMAAGAPADGATITQTVDRAGQVGSDPALASAGVTARDVGALTHHDVASVFWDFMNSSGLVSVAGQTVSDHLFVNPY
ncbi:MAG TPA: hypothetical protein VMU89_15115, partial [Thermomicrobiaceae bacterium]|nr:hypothetical protein [Thermomicrobiaceae bacterium]